MLRDRVRHERMRELEQRCAPTAQKHREIATELPRDRARPEDAGARIGDLLAQRRQRPLEHGARDDHGSWSPSLRRPVKANVRDGHSARARHANRREVCSSPGFTRGTTGARRDYGMKTMVSTAGSGQVASAPGPDLRWE